MVIFLGAGCSPDLGPEVAADSNVARSGPWPFLLTSAEIAALDQFDPASTEDMIRIATTTAGRAARLRARAAQLLRRPVLSGSERRRLQTAANNGQT